MELEGAAGGGEVFDLDNLLHAVRYDLISFEFTRGSVPSDERSPWYWRWSWKVQQEGARSSTWIVFCVEIRLN